jgi:hypothetical protein
VVLEAVDHTAVQHAFVSSAETKAVNTGFKLRHPTLAGMVSTSSFMRRSMRGFSTSRSRITCWQGLADIARHVRGCHLTQETRVLIMAGGYRSPRHGMQLNSSKEGGRRVG